MRLKKDSNEFPFTEKSLEMYIRKTIVKEVNDLKSQVIDDVSQNKHRNLKKPQSFLNKINDLLKFWHDYGVKAMEDVKSVGVFASPKNGLSYKFVKQFMFGNFDFKSVLLYVDGMVHHITDGKDKYTQQDLEDFYNYTIKTAYGTEYNDIDALLSATEINHKFKIPDEPIDFEPQMIRDYELFNESDYTDLYKSIEGVIDFIGNDRLKVLFQLKKEIKHTLLASYAIKSIFDYIIYSVSFFVVRSYIVSEFIRQFVGDPETESYTESVINANDTIEEFMKKMVIFKLDIEQAYWYGESIFASMDELIARDLDKCRFFELFKTFFEMHNIKYSDEDIDNKKFKIGFSKYFKDSQLFNFICSSCPCKYYEEHPQTEEIYLKLKYLLHTPNLALQRSGQIRHDHRAIFIDNLIKISCVDKDSLPILKKSAVFVYHFAKYMFNNYLKKFMGWANDLDFHKAMKIKPSEVTTELKLLSEINNFLTVFNDELSLIVLRIMQYIENKIYYYENEAKRTGKVYDKTSEPEDHYLHPIGVFDQIYVNGQDVFNESLLMDPQNESLKSAMLYPYYDNLRIYSEYVKSIPEFQNLDYYNEDGWWQPAKWIDSIKAWALKIYNEALGVFTKNKLANNAKWVSDHKDDLLNSEYYKEEDQLEKCQKFKNITDSNDFIKKINYTDFLSEVVKLPEDDNTSFDAWVKKINESTAAQILPKWVLNNFETKGDLVKKLYPYSLFYDISVPEDIVLTTERVNDLMKETLEPRKGQQLREAMQISVAAFNSANFENVKRLGNDFTKTINSNIKSLQEQLSKNPLVKESTKILIEGDNNQSADQKNNPIEQIKETESRNESKEETIKQEPVDNSAKVSSGNEFLNKQISYYTSIQTNIVDPVYKFIESVYEAHYNYIAAVWNGFIRNRAPGKLEKIQKSLEKTLNR